MSETLSELKEWSGLVGMFVAGIVYFNRNENKTEDNTQAIDRLEATIEKLVTKIERLLETQSDNKALLSNHEARIVNLEKTNRK